jgi:hypothetical protein
MFYGKNIFIAKTHIWIKPRFFKNYHFFKNVTEVQPFSELRMSKMGFKQIRQKNSPANIILIYIL